MANNHRLEPPSNGPLVVIKGFSRRVRPFQKTRNEKITDLTKLQPGDHVSFYKTDFYYAHHGIVTEARTDYLRVIHYFNTWEHVRSALMRGSIYIAAIIESEWPVNVQSKSEDIYLHHYDNIPCFSNEDTLKRAYSQLGRRGYSLIRNNCEHWARWCRTGEHFSEQIFKFHRLVREKSGTLLIVDPTVLVVKDITLVGMQTFGQFLSVLGSGLILTAVEGLSACIDIKRKKNERKKGSLSDIALKKYVARRITSASGTVIGGVAGTIAGTVLIPVPILGPTVGGLVGSVSGKVIGSIAGVALSKILEVSDRIKESKIKHMTTIPQLINHLSPQSDIVRGLMAITYEHNEDEQISTVIQEALNSNGSALYPSLEEITRSDPNTTPEKCQATADLTTNLFTDSDSFEYFVLTPVPDTNAPEEFASSTDVLVLRWPKENAPPWASNEEHVLDIKDLNFNSE